MTPDAALVDTAELARVDAWWRAANYLSVGQIYLLDNPLLLEPLRAEHIKARLLGHWGTTPGLNFIHAHLNRVITGRDRNIMFVIGPGHGGPAAVAGADDEHDVAVATGDDPVQVGKEEVETRRGAPVAEQAGLDVLGPQRLEQERVVEQVDLADREVVGRPPPGIDPGELSCVNEGCIWCHRQSSGHHRRPAASS